MWHFLANLWHPWYTIFNFRSIWPYLLWSFILPWYKKVFLNKKLKTMFQKRLFDTSSYPRPPRIIRMHVLFEWPLSKITLVHRSVKISECHLYRSLRSNSNIEDKYPVLCPSQNLELLFFIYFRILMLNYKYCNLIL